MTIEIMKTEYEFACDDICVIWLHCHRHHTLSHKQLVDARLAEAAVEFNNPEINQIKVANLALCLDVLKLVRC